MPWLKVDDGEALAPWVMQVGNEAYGVYVRLAGYCAQHLTDGVVPPAVAAMLAGDLNGDGVSRTLGALEVVGRISRDGNGQVTLPFYLDSNPSRAQVEADREARREKASRAAAARWNKDR